MKLGIRFAGIVAILALVVAPAMSCLAARQAMSMDERECCKQMADKCGGKTGSSPKSCCATEDHGAQPYVASAGKSDVSATVHLGLVPSSSSDALPTVSNQHETLTAFHPHSPPRSSPEAIAILRI